jgi:hypothetical protein
MKLCAARSENEKRQNVHPKRRPPMKFLSIEKIPIDSMIIYAAFVRKNVEARRVVKPTHDAIFTFMINEAYAMMRRFQRHRSIYMFT